ncbi:MAG: ribonuclease Z [Bacteroidota bacterium]
MILDKQGNTTLVYQEDNSLKGFLEKLKESYDSIRNDHIIVNLFSFSKLSAGDILEFLEISNNHRATNKSFVLVSESVSYDEIPDEICVVPTVQEARDIIEMEDIERDLDL